MSHATLRNFFLVAPMIYAATGRLAVQHYKPAQLKALKETQSVFAKQCRAMMLKRWRWKTTVFTRSWARWRLTLSATQSRAFAD
jgi:DNA-binding GntR family transcriptional regulator